MIDARLPHGHTDGGTTVPYIFNGAYYKSHKQLLATSRQCRVWSALRADDLVEIRILHFIDWQRLAEEVARD